MRLEELYDQAAHNPVTGCRVWQGKMYREPMVLGKSARMWVWVLTTGDIPVDYGVVVTCQNTRCIAREHLDLEPLPVRMIGGVEVVSMHRKRETITDADAIRIYRAVLGGRTQQDVAQEFGVHKNTVWNVVHGVVHAKAVAAAQENHANYDEPQS